MGHPVVHRENDAVVFGYADSEEEALEVARTWFERRDEPIMVLAAELRAAYLSEDPQDNTDGDLETGPKVSAWVVSVQGITS